MRNVCATGDGSASPVVSIKICSGGRSLATSFLIIRIRSPRTVQQIQPLFISITSSFSFKTRSWSIPISPNSFSITAKRMPCSSIKIRLMRVVFPLPKNPVITVTGIFLDEVFISVDYKYTGIKT